MSTRAGKYVSQPTGYKAFVPAPLPPVDLEIDDRLRRLLSKADRSLGRLDGVASVLPNPDLFVSMYVRHEAVLSSQIEGTQSTLEDVLEYEAEKSPSTKGTSDLYEVFNYVSAMNHGLQRLPTLPLSLRLIREVHAKLLKVGRGAEKSPGDFRTSQNWIGPEFSTLAEAQFVPPPPHEMREALDNFERFLNERETLPVLIQCGLMHAQFETIHPFLDGNGRVGRLLVTLLLCERQVLSLPLLYLSLYLKAHRAQYYDRLMAVRLDGDWEGWLRFFLQGVIEVSNTATETARAILELRERDRERLAGHATQLSLLDLLYRQPIVTVRYVERLLGCAYVTANNAVRGLEEIGLLTETTGQRRNRVYRYAEYLGLFRKQAIPLLQESG